MYWLFLNVYFLGMSILFMLGRVNYRTSERLLATLPVQFTANGRTIHGMTHDISENGFAFYLDFPEFVPESCTFTIQDKDWKANVTGKVVHVAKIKDQWRYSVQLDELSFEEKQNYNQIVFDRFPTLATEIKTIFVQDVFKFFRTKTKHTVQSNRKLPRIELNKEVKCTECGSVKVLDYNYQYMTLENSVKSPVLHVQFGAIELTLIKDGSASGKNLYLVKDWQKVSSSNRIHNHLVQLMA